MGNLVNAAQMTVSDAPGTGTVSLGSATASYVSFAAAGCVDGQKYSYVLRDGVSREWGQGTYSDLGTFSRDTVVGSTNGGYPIIATADAIVSITALADDIAKPDYADTLADFEATQFDYDVQFARIISLADTLVQRVASEPTHPGKYRSADRWLADGTYDGTDGGWWELVTPNGTINVKAFSATGDGVTDDNTALQNAMTYFTLFGGMLYFPVGTYKHSDTLLLDAYSIPGCWQIVGQGATLLPTEDITGSELVISGGKSPDTGLITGLLFDHRENSTLEYGIELRRSLNTTVSRNTFIIDNAGSFDAAYACIALTPEASENPDTCCFWTTITDNSFRPYSGPNGKPFALLLAIGGHNALSVTRNDFAGNSYHAIKCQTDANITPAGMTIIENWFEGPDVGISFDADDGYYWPDGLVISSNRAEAMTTFFEMNLIGVGGGIDHQQPPILSHNMILSDITNYILNTTNALVNAMDLNYYGANLGNYSQNLQFGADIKLNGAFSISNYSGASSWNSAQLGLGGNYFWFNANGALMMSIIPPASDTAGMMIACPNPYQAGTNLPSGVYIGSRAWVDNSNVVMSGHYGDVVASGGNYNVPVWYDGTNWRIG